ncbi:hypothetical protein PENSPDRAFT_685519 [Peniophora sp. CONT]|nr:hypothetical protein PENSPDRAFT_685519 [Peniophora sp. CONT]
MFFSCIICLNEWPDTDALRSLACGHTLCSSCIEELLQLPSSLCPTCRLGPLRRDHIRPVFVLVETRDTPPLENYHAVPARDASTPRISSKILPKMHRIHRELLLWSAPDSNIDPHAIARTLREILTAKECNEVVKDVLLEIFKTFLDNYAASVFEAIRPQTAAMEPSYSHRNEVAALEEIIRDLRTDKISMAKHANELGAELIATQERLARSYEELKFARNEMRYQRVRSYLNAASSSGFVL